MSIIKNGFFAYSSYPSSSGEFIERALSHIRKNNGLVFLESWRNLQISGKLIITEILKKIEKCDFFCADLTGVNDNVLFEIGFAIGKKKPIWLINDTTNISSFNKYKELQLLLPIGYSSYTSSDDIIRQFDSEKVYESNSDVIESIFSTVEQKQTDKILFYLKSQHSTDYNKLIIQKIEDYKFTYSIDDPYEGNVQPLSWYIEHLLSTPSALVEFSSTNKFGYEIHNAKCALVAGLALGVGVKVQMVAEEYYDTPMDYKELLKKFHNLETCKKIIESFLTEVRNELPKFYQQNIKTEISVKARSYLQKLKFGDFIAEHEADDLYDYYVNTVHEQNLIKNEHNIVVGRKGTGKTATLYYLNAKLSKNVKNEVCLIKPIDFEIDGIISILLNLKDEFERGYIIESIWKFLIYTEIMNSIFPSISEKPLYALDKNDEEIIAFVEENRRIVLTDFSTRLEQELSKLSSLKDSFSQADFRLKTAEVLHEGIIKKMKELIINHLSKKHSLVVLIDNLDKSWSKNADMEMVGKFIYGLLNVIGRISKDLKGKPSNPHPFNFCLVIFLRSDIYMNIIQYASEPDKIQITKLVWEDPEIFLRLINERIDILNDKSKITHSLFWDELIVDMVDNESVKDFIFKSIIPRPRDIIFFFTTAKNIAVSRGHTQILASDVKKALQEYSSWVFKTIVVENEVSYAQMEAFLYVLIGENGTLSRDQLVAFMNSASIDISSEQKIDAFLDRLVELSLLGREIRNDEFAFVYDFETDKKIKILASKLGTKRFKIHKAFAPYLEVSDNG
ncbi:P-loop ATPase, Sll1717 family [Deminuibacter soli]|uniref:Uncharacterized protein n=1 Tax=Deminuibacter soli TaxID=2291815 RepID=A0A3E1NQ86_9BACT|nr:hypothetical protein [Deminuibacter soli]RFM30080.1 hypothetical protein DXN05_03655 [Deminuibacter soli]